ncbi:MAG: dockerin type I repeat-containing protein [Ruminococcus sp.]|nr:dockerin type I repeat-containing protein [Ruminococcus sp.]
MKKRIVAVIAASVLAVNALPLCTAVSAAVTVESYRAAAEETKFEAENFFVAVGTYRGATQLRYFKAESEYAYSAEKVVWDNAPADISYGDVFVADGDVEMTRVKSAPDDPVYAMAYYYQLDEGTKLDKVGNCNDLMEKKELTFTNKNYDGSGHWSVDYTDENGRIYTYGYNAFGSSLGVDLFDCNVGDIYTFAMYKGDIVVPLAKKDAESDVNKEPGYRIVQLPDKVEYKTGEMIDLKGLEIEVTKADEEPVVYTYPDIAFAHDSTTPKPAKVLLFSDFRSDKAGTYKVEVIDADNVSFEVKVVDDEEVTAGTIKATVLDINENSLLLQSVSNCYERYLLYNGQIKGDIKPTVGMSLEITYEGGMFNLVPILVIGNVKNVSVISEKTEFLKGDTNCDGQVDMADAVLIMQALANPNKYGEFNTEFNYLTKLGRMNGDMNGDGITVGDAQAIQMKLLGLFDESSEINSKLNDIITIKTDYDPAMSNWSGIGILLEVNSKDYPVTLKAADGHFSTWDIKAGSGPIENVGKTYDAGNSGYIFWTPDELDYTKGFSTEIQAVGVSGDVFIDLGKIYVTQVGHRFTASLKKPESTTSTDNSVIAGKTFVYEKEGFGGDCSIDFKEDGTFLYSPGYLSSYLGGGTWEVSGNKVILTHEDDIMSRKRVNCFSIVGNELIYIEEDSDNFIGIKVKDGEKFSPKANSAVLLGIDKANVTGVQVSSLPEGYDYSFKDKNAQAVVDYLSNLSLSTELSVEDPGQLNGMLWIIRLVYENGDTVTLYDSGRFIHGEDRKWYEMPYEESEGFSSLVWELGKTDNDKSIDNSEYLIGNEGVSSAPSTTQKLVLNCNSFCANGEILKVDVLMGDMYSKGGYPNYDSAGNPEYSIFASQNNKKIDDERLLINGERSEYTKTISKDDMKSLDITGKEGDYTAYYHKYARVDFSDYEAGSTGCITFRFGWKAEGENPLNASSDFVGMHQTMYFYVGENGTGISNNGIEAAQLAYETASDNDIMFYDSPYVKWNGKEVMSNLYEKLRKPTDEVLPISFKMTSSPEYGFKYNGQALAEYARADYSEYAIKLKELQMYGNQLQYGETIYTTGMPDGTKRTKEWYEERVEYFGEELLSKYIVDGEFLEEKLRADINELMNNNRKAYEEAEKAYFSYISDEAIKQLDKQNIRYEYMTEPKRLVIYVTAEEFKSLTLDNVTRYGLDISVANGLTVDAVF